jgi:hypothetical protein
VPKCYSNEPMKLSNFSSVALAMIGIASTGFAADYSDWVAKGYRWSAVNGPHAYIKKEDAKDERLRLSNKPVSEVIGRAYYLRRGKVVLVVETEAASSLSRIRMGGVTSDLWTPTKNLSTRPLRNTVGVIETPDMAGILRISSATPTPRTNAKPAASLNPSPVATPRR